MTVGDGGKTYFISGQWDPTIRDLLVLNTETPKGVSVTVNTTFRIFFLFQPFHYKEAQICTMLGRLESWCLKLKNWLLIALIQALSLNSKFKNWTSWR